MAAQARILVVEDEADIAGLIKHTLERSSDAQVEIVGTGDAALKAIRDRQPDLMILDLREPAFVPFNSAARQIVFAEAGRAIETVLVAGRPVVRGGNLVTVDEAELAAQVEEIAPGFRREVEALAQRSRDLIGPLLEGSRAAFKVPLGFERYIGRGKT